MKVRGRQQDATEFFINLVGYLNIQELFNFTLAEQIDNYPLKNNF